MIESLLCETCKIYERQSGTEDEWNEFTFTPSEDKKCLFLNKAGELVKTDTGNDVVISGFLLMKEEPNPQDQLIYDSYIYDIVPTGKMHQIDLITGDAEYYKIAVARRRPYQEEAETIL